MTADIELLPLPELASERVFGAKWDDFDMQDYARANVAHATEPLKAEIERLRALLLEACDDGDEADADLLATLERTRTAQAEVDRLRRMVQERDNMLGRRPCAGVNADGKPRCFELVDARAEIEALRAEVEEEKRSVEHTHQWYAVRLEKIKEVAKRVGLWSEVAAIIANGSSSIYDPPTYAQQLNIAKHETKAAEARAERLAEALRFIAEGNLGSLPWQAGFSRIREHARDALRGHDQEGKDG